MEIAEVLMTARRRAGLTLRGLALRAGTSHSALAAYESGRKVPRAETMIRVLEAAGQRLVVEQDPTGSLAERIARGGELEAALRLAAQFPTRLGPALRYPIFAAAA